MELFVLFTQEGYFFLLRWIHFLAGIAWIGMLYYFNLVQTPFFATELGGQARGLMVRGLLPNALWWFRWGAMFTFLTGWIIVISHIATGTATMAYYTLVLTGGLIGSIMWFNVWFVIWPAQRLAIASAERVASGGEANPEAAARAPIAGRASRTNTLFSIPMLFFMGSARHFTSLVDVDPSWGAYWLLMLIVIALVEANIWLGNASSQKPLTTVSGTIHTGLGVTLVLYLLAAGLL
jgi:uncharacterized membrane protein